MKRVPRTCGCLVVLALTALSTNCSRTGDGEWVSLFDGTTLSGWTKGGSQDSNWEVKDGSIVGTGKSSMLYSPKTYKNFRLRTELKINDGGNSGVYFRSPTADGDFSKGYEAQVDSTHRDPIRTGSLYTFIHIYDQIVPPDTWFTYEIEAVTKEFRGQRDSPHQGLDQRQAALRVPRSRRHVEGGPFRLPAARSGQPGRDSQGRGPGVTLTTTSMV